MAPEWAILTTRFRPQRRPKLISDFSREAVTVAPLIVVVVHRTGCRSNGKRCAPMMVALVSEADPWLGTRVHGVNDPAAPPLDPPKGERETPASSCTEPRTWIRSSRSPLSLEGRRERLDRRPSPGPLGDQGGRGDPGGSSGPDSTGAHTRATIYRSPEQGCRSPSPPKTESISSFTVMRPVATSKWTLRRLRRACGPPLA